MTSFKKLLFLSFLIALVLHNFSILAAPDSPNDELGIDLTIQDVGNRITGFACWLLGVILAIMVIALIIAGVRFFLARDNEPALTSAKKNLTWTLVGILVILATNIIIATIANALGRDYSFIPLKCVTTAVRYDLCRGPSDCSEGFTCVINPGQEIGSCIKN